MLMYSLLSNGTWEFHSALSGEPRVAAISSCIIRDSTVALVGTVSVVVPSFVHGCTPLWECPLIRLHW